MEWLSTPFGLLAAVLAIAALIQGASGFGFALLVAPVVRFVDPSLLPAVVLLWLIPLNAHVALRERSAIDVRGARWIVLARLDGSPAGLAVLMVVPERHAGPLIGGMTLLAVVATLVIPAFDPGCTAYLGAGLVSGIGETAAGIGGPPLALVYQHRPPPEVRSTVAACSLVGEIASLTLLMLYGRVSMHDVGTAAALLPAAALGALLGAIVRQLVDGPRLRILVLAFAVVSSVLLIV